MIARDVDREIKCTMFFPKSILYSRPRRLPLSEWGLSSLFINYSSHPQFSAKTMIFGKCIASGCANGETRAADLPRSGAFHASPMFLKPQVVIYDGICHLCNAGVRRVIKADKYKRLSFCAVQSELAKAYLLVCGLTREDVLNRFLFVEGPGQFSQASTAALRVMLYLPFPYPILSILLVIPTPLRDAVYDYIARRRYKWFGQSTKCILPSDDILDRFVDREELVDNLKEREQE